MQSDLEKTLLPRTGITLMQRGQNEKDFYVLLVSLNLEIEYRYIRKQNS